MKNLFLIVFLTSILGNSQEKQSFLDFNKKYFDAVDKWVALPKENEISEFYFGFIYIDEQAGFTFHIGSTFTIDSTNTFRRKPIDSAMAGKYRIDNNWQPVAIIPKEKLSELNLPLEPEWLKIYKENSDDVSYLKNIGYHYNHVGASNLALKPLTKAYEINPHFSGLEFELSFAYNALGQFENAILILEKAIENNPQFYYFYRELGFAYKNLNKLEEADKTYTKGIELSDNDFEKSEMAVNMAQSYFLIKDKEKFNKWAEITRKFAEEGSKYAQFIDLFEQKWNDK